MTQEQTTEVIEPVQPVETSVEPVQPETPAEASVEPEVSVEPTVEPEVTPEVEAEPEPEVKEETTEGSAEPVVVTDLNYQGINMSVTIPEDALKMCSDKGLDASELVKELYGSEDFNFSAETREKLNESFGSFFVDAILGGLKAQQGQIMSDIKAAEVAAFENVSSIVGGEEGWGKLEAFAATLPSEVTEEFNQIMQTGTPYMQRLAVSDLVGQMNGNEPAVAQPLNLIEGSDRVSSEPTMLNAEEYRAILRTDEYKANPAKYDQMRRNGMAQGI